MPALRFGAANSHRVAVLPSADLNTLAAFTWAGIVRRTGASLGAGNALCGKNDPTFPDGWGPRLVHAQVAAGDVRFLLWRTSSDEDFRTDGNALPLNQWRKIAVAYDRAQAGAARCRIYHGPVDGPLIEATYAVQTTSADTVIDDSASSFYIGNQGTLTQSFLGDIARWATFTGQLSLGLLRTLDRDLSTWLLPQCVGLWELGANGTGQQVDLSGNRNYGLVTSATVIDGPAPKLQPSLLPRRIGFVPAAASFQSAWAGLASRIAAPAVAA
jgi:hypothetical protein